MTRKKIIVVAVVCFVFVFVGTVRASNHLTVEALQSLLDSILQDDGQIVLTEGTDFLAPPGTVIFLSRELGMERMVSFARAGEPELSMLFLPNWEAWITETVERKIAENIIDTRYTTAALVAGMEVELWHTHNDIGETLTDEEKLRKRSLQWTMPSSADLNQLYAFATEIPEAKFRGVIANIYGVTSYWNDNPLWAQSTFIKFVIEEEANWLNMKASELSVTELGSFAENHEGFMRIQFQPVP